MQTFYGIFLTLVGLCTIKGAFLSLNEEVEKCFELNRFLDLSNSQLLKRKESISDTAKIECLNLQDRNLEYLTPSTFNSFPNLKYLNLANNNVQKRNLDFLSKMKNLEMLVLDKTYRTRDGGEFEFHINAGSSTLQSLYLRDNGIKKLIVSHDIHFSNLTTLVLSSNNIREININENGLLSETNFEWLPQSLKYLLIDNNNLKELILINKTELVEVQVRNSDFKTLKLENLPNLKSFQINEESLNVISLKNLSKLEDLLIGFDETEQILYSDINGLTALQSFELGCRNLILFDGKIVDNMPSLRSLFIGSSLLSAIPEINNASNLMYLSFPKNKIEILKPGDFLAMPNLEEVNLSDNLIRKLEPFTFSNLKKLRILNLEKNFLKIVSYKAFSNIKNLQKLRFTHNSINFFDGRIVDFNPFLMELHLGSNFLEQFPVITNAKNLWQIDLGGNKFNVLEGKNFGTVFNRLEMLTLSFNNLTKIEREVFDNLKNLKHLHLHSNRMQIMPEGWSSSLMNLESVTMEKNEFNDYESLKLEEANFVNTALSYSLKNDYFLYCTLRYGLNCNCMFLREYKDGDKVVYFKKKYMTFKKVGNDKLKLFPSTEM